MAREDQTQRHINSSSTGGAGGSGSGGGGGGGGGSGSGGRGRGDAGKSCNKSKQKKVPQRGLGVAQLEKIRIEEHMKENEAYLQPLQPRMFLQPPNSALYSGPRQHGLIPSIEAGSNSMSTSGNEMGWPAGSCSVCVRWPHLQGQCQNVDYRTIQSNTGHLPCNLQHPAPSPMVNIPAGTSKAPMWNFQPQPPPNQFYGGNYYTPEEERMVGMKRSYDQSAMEDTPGSCAAFIPGRAETAHHNDGSTTQPAHPMGLREFPILSDPKRKKVMNESEGSNGDFLTLAPPKIELPRSYLSPHHQEVTDSDAQPYQGTRDEPAQQPFFTFLPSAKSDSDQPEDEEEVDLNLKL